MKKNQNNRGYTLVEIIFYIALFSILSIAVIDSLITMTKAFKETSVQAELMQGGTIMERISREIRQANSISSISSNDLKLGSKDSGGSNKTIEFLLSGSNINLLENDAPTGNLNSPNVSVTSLDFSEINTTKGKAVKVALSVKSNHDEQNRIESFYDTIVLRGDY